MPPILTLRDAEISFGESPLFEGVALSISRGERACLVGRNGSGKSTLLKIIAGEIELDTGDRYAEPGLVISYLHQEPDYDARQNVASFIEEGLTVDKKATRQYRIRDLVGELRLNGTASMGALSGGEKRRAAIARALVCDPDLLLLDEPTNHLDIQTVDWLEDTLANNRAAILTISHDRAFLRNLSAKSYWMDRGTLRVNDKGYADFERWSDEVVRAEESARNKLEKRIAAESDWLIHGVTARRKRNQGRLRELDKMRQMRAKQLRASGRLSERVSLELEEGTPASRRVIEAHNISKAYGDNIIVKDFSTRISRGDRVAIVGPNGVGKTTLVRLLTGQLEPDSGRIRFGNNLELLYFDQERETLDPKYTLWETLTDKEHGGGGDSVHIQGRTRHVVAYLKDFLFSDKQARQPVGALSGGEKNRLLLAKAFTKPSNLLVLDEPTNDLDMDMLDVLEEQLSNFDGTLILISHDRDFIDRLVTSTISFDPDGQIREYAGGYTDMMLQQQGRKHDDPHQIVLSSSGVTKQKRRKPSSGIVRKLSYKDQRALDMLPAEIDATELQIAALEQKLGNPDLYGKGQETVADLAAQLETAKTRLDDMHNRWLDLEEQREALEDSGS